MPVGITGMTTPDQECFKNSVAANSSEIVRVEERLSCLDSNRTTVCEDVDKH